MKKITIVLICLLFINTASAKILQLSETEAKWLAQHKIIRIAYDDHFAPFEWLDEKGQYQGISIDTLKIIEKKLNLKFQQVKLKNWSEILLSFRTGQIDMVASIAKNKKRQEYILFTEPYVSAPGVIISSHAIKNITELTGKKVGVVNDSYWDDLLSGQQNKIHIVRTSSTEFAVELTAIGSIDAMVSDLASVSYAINKAGISHLQVVPVPENKKQKIELAIGVRKDWPQLQSIIQKTLDSIDKNEKDKIYNKWIKLQKVSFWQSEKFWTMVLLVGLIISSLFVIIILWNRSLKLQVARRTEALEKAQLQLIHAEKMESIGRLSAGIAHEVKNPLAILQMSIDYLKGEDNNETINTILVDMDDAVVRADAVIKGLLDFSREKELLLKPANINDVIEKSLRLIEHELKQRNIQLQLSLASDLVDFGMDKNRLQQVFINLFMNAAQAIGNTGHITINTKMEKLSDQWFIDHSEEEFSLEQKVITIEILDTGCGISKDNEKSLFEPFFTTKPVGEGTGLGLSVSKSIIRLHHGMIAMRNRKTSKQTGVEIKIAFALL